MNLLISILFIALASTSLFAGDAKGNGGDILVCENKNEFHSKSLDEYELETKYKLSPVFISANKMSETDEAIEIVKRINFYSPHRVERLIRLIRSFNREVKFVRFPLSDINDSGKVSLPKNCKLLQVINQNKKILPPSKAYLVRSDIWNALSRNTRISLILHEVIYRDNPSKDSIGIRKFNSYLIANELSNFDFARYLNLLVELGFKSNTIAGLRVDLGKKTEFWTNGVLKKATPVNKSKFFGVKPELVLRNIEVEFYSNSSLKSFCPYDVLEHYVGDVNINVYCTIFLGGINRLHFYRSGKLKSAISAPSELKMRNYKLFLGKMKKNRKGPSLTNFFESGGIFKVNRSSADVYVGDQILEIKSKPWIVFYENGFIEQAFVSNFPSIILAGTRVSISGDTGFYPDGKIFKTFATTDFEVKIQTKNIVVKSGEIELYANSNLKKFTLAKESLLRTVSGGERLFPADSSIVIDRKALVVE